MAVSFSTFDYIHTVILMKHSKSFKIGEVPFFYLSFVYMELIVRIFTCRPFFGWGLLFMCIFSVVPALLLSALGHLIGKKAVRIIGAVGMILLTVLYATQVVYHGFFGKYMIFFSFFNGGATQIIEGGIVENTISALVKGIPAMLLLAVPIVLFFVFKNNIKNTGKDYFGSAICGGVAIIISLLTPLVISWIPSFARVQSGAFDPNLSVKEFGLLYTEALDIKYNVFGIEQDLQLEEEYIPPETQPPVDEEEGVDTSPNVMNIDFGALNEGETDDTYKTLNEYFAERTPTNKNKYTGMYEGYNLITITAEGFSPYAVDPVLTPTLYKMSQEGFKFTNFYTPIWGVSTSDGEYTACTGLIPKSGVWSFYRSGSNYMPFTLGNMFKSIGVDKTFAYHNNTYTYYHREVSHPNMGYTYKGVGNGVEEYINEKWWPQSDHEMILGSMEDYLSDDKPFHAYYMTVSGHLNYTKIGNMQAYRNWDAVKDLDCSDELKAYFACNIELDKAMEALLQRLNEEGVADKTVIMITPDHYPYGLEKEGSDKYAAWRELLGHEVDPTFELYKSNLILYCQGTTDAPTIDKYCYSVDILPTILNLFGFEYDSRLLMGSDILSTANQLVIFSDRSFITERGMYSADTKEFTLFGGAEGFADDEEKEKYISGYKSIVSNKFQISAKILDSDYYGYVFGR